MFNIKKNIIILLLYFIISLSIFYFLSYTIIRKEVDDNKIKKTFLNSIHIYSPAIITGGRNIAFESGIAIANAPGSYLNLLDCCESDEAISSRIALGKTNCKVIKK